MTTQPTAARLILISGACRDAGLTGEALLQLVADTVEPGEPVEVTDAGGRQYEIIGYPDDDTLCLIEAGEVLAIIDTDHDTAERWAYSEDF